MTRYTVVWDENVESPFMHAWFASNSATRAILREIADWVDTNLARDPELLGSDQPDERTRVVAVPLTGSTAEVSVTFEVREQDRIVRVVRLTYRT